MNCLDYILIQAWMLNELKLTGNKLLIFAVIYSFTHNDKEHLFKGGIRYLMDSLHIGRQTVIDNLNALCEEGYIEKESGIINNTPYAWYRSSVLLVQNPYGGSTESVLKNNIRNNKELYDNSSSLSEDKNISSSIDSNIIEERRQNNVSFLKILNKFPVVMSDFRAVDAISGWIESRKKTNKKPPTDRAIELAIRKAIRFSEETPQHSVADYFDNATLNGWQGIFQFKDGESVTGNKVSYQKNIRVAPDYNPKYVPQKATKFSFDEEDS